MVWLFSRDKIQQFLSLKSKSTPSIRNEHTKVDSGTTRGSHKVDNLEKRFLVWTKKYKTIEEVPAYVPQNVMERARNRMRIRIANYMMAATALGCLLMVYLGKKDKERGDSVVKRNLDWHRQYNEEQNAKEAAQKK